MTPACGGMTASAFVFTRVNPNGAKLSSDTAENSGNTCNTAITANTAATAKYMGTVLDQACISAVAAVSVVSPCYTAFWLI